ncbi:MAG TPA: hypothetical protein PLE19_21230 [Planctomycetota bacterium]|nr:hypothetical protein [Planctomycetota bacterium]HRR82150.1 hypothetical protein [Planctomycetota bacterium]HRT97353.1 hypothetical protein [Planctomycetota bacterium]
MTRRLGIVLLLVGAGIVGCAVPKQRQRAAAAATFAGDLAFLKKHSDVLVLSDKSGQAQVAVVPLYQGRVMTSSATGPEGLSFGWINRELIASGQRKPQFNPLGGEDRFWIGPEGGQFSIYFPKGASDKFDFKDWQVPAPIDWGGWNVVASEPTRAHFRNSFSLVNFSGTKFDVVADRIVRLLDPEAIKASFGIDLPGGVKAVAYESDNSIRNAGQNAWVRETGALSIWILCMYNPSPATTAVIPYLQGPEDQLGPIVNDSYFGKVPPDRLKAKDGVIFFKCDGKQRGKIGLSPRRAKPIMGSYDAANRVLTLATYTKPEGATDYVNSMWEIQKEPFKGDVVNSYNDGPTPAGPPLGPFYELESSSPAAFLKPGESLKHVHRTMHLVGPEAELDKIARATLGVGLADIKAAFQ